MQTAGIVNVGKSITSHSSKMAALLVPAIAMQLAMLYDLDVYDDQDNDDEDPIHIRPFILDASFDVEILSDEYCVQQFRFTCTQLKEIISVLKILLTIKTYARDNVDSLTVLCMAIYRCGVVEVVLYVIIILVNIYRYNMIRYKNKKGKKELTRRGVGRQSRTKALVRQRGFRLAV